MSFLSSIDAEDAFYSAFEAADIEAMRTVLALDDDCICIHPGGTRIEGARAVLESWAAIFQGGAALRIAVSGTVVQATELLAVHHVIENLSYGDDYSQSATVAATNVYRRSDNGWHMVAHCAAPGRAVRSQGTMH